MKNHLFFLVLSLSTFALLAQDIPTPAAKQTERLCLKGGTIHNGTGQVLENGYLVFENGKITGIIKAGGIKTEETLGRVIDVTGRHIYPGIISLNAILGLTEIEAVRSTNDIAETGPLNPNARAVISYNTDSRVIPTVRSNGVLYSQIVPQGGKVSGTSAVVQLDAWNWEDAAVKPEDGIFMNWPSMYKVKGWWAEPEGYELNKEYDKSVAEMKEYLNEGKAYNATNHDKKNLRLEAMKGLYSGRANLYIRVAYIKEMLHAIALGEEMGIKVVLVGAADSYLIADVLAQKHIPVILQKSHELPSYNDEDIQQPFKTPAILAKAGVLYAISIGGFWQERNLMFEAGTAAAYGLTKEQALAAVTSNSAKILGLESRIGSINEGKDASFVISTGDILDMRTSNIEMAFIDGRQINLDNKQKELYKKFAQKYGLKVD